MKTIIITIIIGALLPGCTGKLNQADAYGTFEATEVIVSAETNGRIIKFDAREGSEVIKGSEIVLIDTTILHLQKAEIDAGMKSVITRLSSVNAQNDIIDQQITNININVSRIEKMLKDDAATQKQYDDLTGQVAVLQKQKVANGTQKASIEAELSVLRSKKALLNEQIERSRVKSPVGGTLIEKYSEEGELTTAGKPLMKIADLKFMRLRVYISGAQLGSIKTGQNCLVRTDDGKEGYSTFNGTISYISGKALRSIK